MKKIKIPVVLMSLLPVCCLFSFQSPTFFVEHARTEEQRDWGLMQRRFLPENQGMLFHYSSSQKVNIWSFNCYIDLDVAFIDEKWIVQEIRPLKSFPDKMDSARPVFSCKDFVLYSESDPVVLFFQNENISSSLPVKYVLEMNLGWFEKNHIQIGSTLHLGGKSNTAFFTN